MLCGACAPRLWEEYLCDSPFAIPGADDAAAALFYTGGIAAAMRRYKFHRETALCRWFAVQCAACLSERVDEWRPDLITYVPLGASRWWSRGFNQNKPVARALGKALELPVCASLGKYPSVGKQSRRSAEERRRAAQKLFFALPNAPVRGKRVVLLDDVVTTGSTAADAVRALRQAGASQVFVLAMTRTPQRRGARPATGGR